MKSLNIRKKLVTLAVASAVSGGAMMAMTAPAHAMNISQNNVGQVLLFPYYTVKNGLDTIFTVTNTTNKTAIFKVRFREALNSREVRDFNVILSPNDHWSAGVTSITATGGALVRTFDKTCTSPRLPASATATGATEVAFTNALYSGIFKDSATEDISRVQEGYFEVFLMGVSTRDTAVSANTLEYNAKHVSGVPRDCAKVDDMFLSAGLTTLNGYMLPPENILKGHVTYINVANGTAIDAEPTAIEGFMTSDGVIYPSADAHPTLADGDVSADIFFLDNGAANQVTMVGSSHRAVTGLLAATSVVNEFATGAGAATSWVVTFPTKWHFVDNITGSGTVFGGTPVAPFSEWFADTLNPLANGKSCDNVSFNLYNREEGETTPSGTQFSPVVAGAGTELCYEVNVINFNASSVFGAGTNRLSVDTTGVGTAGWARLNFTETAAITGLTSGSGDTLFGLPVIGFAATVRDAGGAAVNYGSSTEHAIVRKTQ